MSRSDKLTASTAASDSGSRGTGGDSPAKPAEAKNEPLVKSVLIEPRHNEPPRVSVSVEYEGRAPDVKALQKAAMGAIHDVVSAQTGTRFAFVDLGERQNVQRGELTKCFSVESGGEKVQ